MQTARWPLLCHDWNAAYVATSTVALEVLLPILQKRSTAHYCTAAPVHITDYVCWSLTDTVFGKTADVAAKRHQAGHSLDLGSSLMSGAMNITYRDCRRSALLESGAQLNVLDSLPNTQYPVHIPMDCSRNNGSPYCLNSSVFGYIRYFSPETRA